MCHISIIIVILHYNIYHCDERASFTPKGVDDNVIIESSTTTVSNRRSYIYIYLIIYSKNFRSLKASVKEKILELRNENILDVYLKLLDEDKTKIDRRPNRRPLLWRNRRYMQPPRWSMPALRRRIFQVVCQQRRKGSAVGMACVPFPVGWFHVLNIFTSVDGNLTPNQLDLMLSTLSHEAINQTCRHS